MDNDYQQIAPKMSGYLERKERKTMICSYKRYWFVLDGTLLAYYRSKDEYTAISPCKGTITLGPTCHVKPCTSNNGVFQIESKTTTITLRAETKEDQHRWMQAIILALNQKMEYKKQNHFRHSVGEMPKPCDDSNNAYIPKKPLSAQVSLHSRASHQSLIDRLQKMGAKSYVGTISKNLQTTFNLPNYQAQKLKSFSTESLPYLSKQNMENLNKNLENLNNSKKNIAATSINSIYDTLDHLKDDLFFDKNAKSSPDTDEGIYENIPCNDEFNGEIQNHPTTLITNNDIYWDSKQLEYVEHPDINHNHHKLPINEDDEVYTDIDQVRALAEDNGNSEYMEIDPNIDYIVIQEADVENKTCIRNSSSSSQESQESCVNGISEKKRRFGFRKKTKKAHDEKDKKVKKSESFLQRVLNKKSKNKKNATQDAESTDLCAEETVKKLSELKNMLIEEKAMLYARQRRQSVTGEMESQSNRESMLICNDLYSCSGDILGASSTNQGDLPAPSACPSLPPRNQAHITSSTELASSPIYMVPPLIQIAQPNTKLPPKVPPKRKKTVELASSNLDAVLFDLNKDAMMGLGGSRIEEADEGDSKDAGKVKELIRRYSHKSEGEDVEMRKKKPPRSNLHSPSELDKLLDELSKVTIAPIMTPGVTTSLINPEVADQEMLKMVSQRRRRNSDPDYDIPRPHRSLTNLPKKDDNALEATRFFGPILKPSDLPNYAGRPITPPVDYSNLPSITPDSLELECTKTNVTHDELHRFSYDSHDYKRFNKQSHYNLDGLESVYSEPKFLMLRSNGFFSYDSPMSSFHLEGHESRFVDSLEP